MKPCTDLPNTIRKIFINNEFQYSITDGEYMMERRYSSFSAGILFAGGVTVGFYCGNSGDKTHGYYK